MPTKRTAKVIAPPAGFSRPSVLNSPPSPRAPFHARLYQIALVRWVDLPKRDVDALGLPRADIKGGGFGLNAILRFNDDLDRVTLLPGKRGRYKLAFKAELLRAAGAKPGDRISFTLEPDTSSREPDLPAELARAFQSRPELRERWLAHSVAIRRQVVRYITGARTLETQTKRCWIFIERLAETGKLQS